jgi:hypothetical protein
MDFLLQGLWAPNRLAGRRGYVWASGNEVKEQPNARPTQRVWYARVNTKILCLENGMQYKVAVTEINVPFSCVLADSKWNALLNIFCRLGSRHQAGLLMGLPNTLGLYGNSFFPYRPVGRLTRRSGIHRKSAWSPVGV